MGEIQPPVSVIITGRKRYASTLRPLPRIFRNSGKDRFIHLGENAITLSQSSAGTPDIVATALPLLI